MSSCKPGQIRSAATGRCISTANKNSVAYKKHKAAKEKRKHNAEVVRRVSPAKTKVKKRVTFASPGSLNRVKTFRKNSPIYKKPLAQYKNVERLEKLDQLIEELNDNFSDLHVDNRNTFSHHPSRRIPKLKELVDNVKKSVLHGESQDNINREMDRIYMFIDVWLENIAYNHDMVVRMYNQLKQ